jgi:EAL domain-containing protein (putative c-di-GMP-specific phosphodiesterase class I)
VAIPRSASRSRTGQAAATRRIAEQVQRGVDVALQPIVNLDTGEIVSVEALARFSDGRSPDKWFSEAASLGLGTALELAAIEGAMARMSELPRSASLNINVSAATASTTALSKALAHAPAGRVVLEITEHVPVTDYPSLSLALAGLRARGIRVAIDDAGAGFASMQHVLRLQPDVVKLDASLVRDMDSQPAQRALVSALVSFANATGCSLVAEGIETAGELDAVRALGVTCAQGFHLGMPEAAGPSRWQVQLPRKPRRSATAYVRGFGRFVRPASLFLAAALAWPGIVAVAGFEGPLTGTSAEKPPVIARSDSGASGSRVTAEKPAAASISSSKPEAARKVEASVPVTQPSPSRAAPPSTKPKGPVVHVVQDVTELTQTLTEDVTNSLGHLLEGVLGG